MCVCVCGCVLKPEHVVLLTDRKVPMKTQRSLFTTVRELTEDYRINS